MWRKELKRVWRLPRDTHSFLLVPLCATISIMDELCRRSCNFINAYMFSDCSLISFFSRQGIFYSRMASPLGWNTHFCCMRYGGRTQDISFIRNNYINYRVTSNLPEDVLQTAGFLCELCFLRDASFTSSSSCFSSEEINYLISDVSRYWVLCHIVCYMYIGNFHIVHWCCT